MSNICLATAMLPSAKERLVLPNIIYIICFFVYCLFHFKLVSIRKHKPWWSQQPWLIFEVIIFINQIKCCTHLLWCHWSVRIPCPPGRPHSRHDTFPLPQRTPQLHSPGGQPHPASSHLSTLSLPGCSAPKSNAHCHKKCTTNNITTLQFEFLSLSTSLSSVTETLSGHLQI